MSAALFAFFCFLRKSNVSLKHSTGDISAHDLHPPRRRDIFLDNQFWLRLRFTKTIQFGERELLLAVPVIDNNLLDPLLWYRRHLALSPSQDPDMTAFAFRDPLSGQMCPLLHRTFVLKTKNFIRSAGLDPAKFSGHSYRKGGATFAFENGVPGELIKVMGDWTSAAYLLYLNFSHTVRQRVAPIFAKGVRATPS